MSNGDIISSIKEILGGLDIFSVKVTSEEVYHAMQEVDSHEQARETAALYNAMVDILSLMEGI